MCVRLAEKKMEECGDALTLFLCKRDNGRNMWLIGRMVR